MSSPHDRWDEEVRARTVDPDLFLPGAPDPTLVGGRCRACGAVAFPLPAGCARCTATDVAPTALPRVGTLWTFTVQGFPPKAPPYFRTEDARTFVPFGVGYVDLGEVRVEARLTESRPEHLAIGAPMELVVVDLGPGDDGVPLLVPAFAPGGAS